MSIEQTSFKAIPPTNGVLVTTARLKLVQAQPSDLELLQKLFADPCMTTFLGGPASNDNIQKRLHNWEIEWSEGKSFCGIVEEKHSSKRIGAASIHPSRVPNQLGAEISYMILLEYQRLGYATEMSRALVQYAFQVVKIDQIFITTEGDNGPSNKIAERLGFHCQGEFAYVNPGIPNVNKHFVWILRRSTNQSA